MSEDSRRGWDRFFTRHNMTAAAFFEALGLDLLEGRSPIPDRIIKRAQDIDRQRRSRR